MLIHADPDPQPAAMDIMAEVMSCIPVFFQCLYGIRWDDYDYAEVNDLLHR
jgi:hypothetical protein